MPTQTLGKVKLTPRGAYDPAATYVPLDIVSYGGGSYCVLKNVTGVTPTGDDVNYQLLAESGADGKSPQISASKTWLVWDADAGEYVDTGVSAAGAKGDDGDPGKAPIIGSNGNWYVWDDASGAYADTGKPSRGEKGAIGAAGADGNDGRDGTDGITPTIGENGNWYLGATDTGKPSRGADGATGATGATGEKGADGKSAYAYAVEGGYTGTEAEFAAKLAEEMPDKLPNPNALTFTGAVTGTYDGSAPLSVEIPSGGGSGSDISLGLTGAAAGQIAKITAVDDTGKPTAWEAVDMPSGGGGDDGAKEFRLIQSITLGEQSDRVDISVDSSGNAFALHEVYVMLAAQSYGNAENVTFLPNGRWTSGDAYIISSNKSSSSSDNWKTYMIFHSVYADGIICSEQFPAKGQNNSLMSAFAANQTIITKISIVCKFAAGCTFLVIGR